jgi:hypothetical protein
MNSIKIVWLASSLLGILLALFAAHGCTVVKHNDAQLGDVQQGADGCGAWRRRGFGNVDCQYLGRTTGSFYDQDSGRCLNDSQVECTFGAVHCEWRLATDASWTSCTDPIAPLCQSLPPEADIMDVSPAVVNLSPGDKFCDRNPPPTAEDFERFCEYNVGSGARIALQYGAFCSSQSSRNEGGYPNCCIPCSTPSGGAGAAGEEICSGEDN